MRVVIKFALTVVLVLVLIRTVEGFLTIQRETSRLDAAIQRDARLLGRMLRTSVRSAWLANGREPALGLIEAMNVGEHPMRLSWASSAQLKTRLEGPDFGRLEEGETVAVRRHDEERGDLQYFYVPIGITGADGAIQLTETLEERSRYVQHALVREIVAGSVVGLTSAMVVILPGVFVIGRPLNRLRERIHRIGEGDLSGRLVLGGRDELATLAEGLNEMCARLSASRERERAETDKRIAVMEQVRHMDRLTTIGRLASGIAHELGTPLNVISGRAGMIIRSDSSEDIAGIKRGADAIKSQAERMTEIIRHLLDFARQRPPKRVKTDGGEIVRKASDLVSCLGYRGAVRIELGQDGASSRMTAMDPVQMQQVMTNLIENALQSMPDGGDAVVTVKSVRTAPPEGVDQPPGRFLQITVEDQGVGIAEKDVPSIFDPFFTTKDVGQGTGLGLSITYGIVREHGGWIDVSSTQGRGSRFAVYLPQEHE